MNVYRAAPFSATTELAEESSGFTKLGAEADITTDQYVVQFNGQTTTDDIKTSFENGGRVYNQMTDLLAEGGLSGAPSMDGIAKKIWTDIVQTNPNLNLIKFNEKIADWVTYTSATGVNLVAFLNQANGGITLLDGDILLFPIDIISTTYKHTFYFRFIVTVPPLIE
jgi:hypothetical protein